MIKKIKELLLFEAKVNEFGGLFNMHFTMSIDSFLRMDLD